MVAGGALSASLTLASFTRAQAPAPGPRGVELVLTAPKSCPDEAYVRSAIERLAGPRALAKAPQARVKIDVQTTAAGAFRAVVSIEHPGNAAPRDRSIDGPTCAEVTDAAAVAVALALEPPVIPVPPPPPSEEIATAPPPPSGTLIRPAVRLSLGFEAAGFPAPVPVAEIAVAFLVGRHRFEAFGFDQFSAEVDATAGGASGATFSLTGGGFRYCYGVPFEAFEIGPCGSFEAALINGHAFGVQSPKPGHSPWLAPGLDFRAAWSAAPTFAITLALGGQVPLFHERFYVTGLGDLWRPPPIAARGLVGLEIRFR